MAEIINMPMVEEYSPFQGRTPNLWAAKSEEICELIDKSYIPTKLKIAKKSAIEQIFKTARGCMVSGFPFRLVMRASDKKAMHVMNARNIDEVEQVMKLSTSHIQPNGMVVTGKYHIPEEELILLGAASKMGPLSEQAQKRFVELHELCFSRVHNEEEDDE